MSKRVTWEVFQGHNEYVVCTFRSSRTKLRYQEYKITKWPLQSLQSAVRIAQHKCIKKLRTRLSDLRKLDRVFRMYFGRSMR